MAYLYRLWTGRKWMPPWSEGSSEDDISVDTIVQPDLFDLKSIYKRAAGNYFYSTGFVSTRPCGLRCG
jgi:hypothetical protein